jgi:acetyl-CoA/propionyl-CoA carboxylase biotin carboxyl carrier protein
MKMLQVVLNGERVKVWAEKIDGTLWYHFNGETRSFTPEVKYGSGQSQKASVHPGVITAPMPGKIIKVNVTVGETVKAGAVVVTMEAMKMEYALEADLDGVIEYANLKMGDQVTLGQVLVKIKSESANESK